MLSYDEENQGIKLNAKDLVVYLLVPVVLITGVLQICLIVN